MNRARKVLPLLLLGAMALAMIMGCSNESPLAPSDSNFTRLEDGITLDPSLTTDGFQFSSRVATIDLDARTLTFTDPSYTAVAAEDCEVFRMEEGVVVPMTFGDIQVGDSVQVCGVLQENDIILANRIRVYDENECDPYDVAFGGTITAIDYAAGTFMVTDRAETIVVDGNTVIWTRISQTSDIAAGLADRTAFAHDPGQYKFARDTILAFTDLAVGDWVEVKADIVDANTLLAVTIKLAPDCLKKCIEFTDFLATVDYDTRTVTFENTAWVGLVCPNALLTGLDGESLTLADFAPADLVAVKGFALEGDTLRICEMVKQ